MAQRQAPPQAAPTSEFGGALWRDVLGVRRNLDEPRRPAELEERGGQCPTVDAAAVEAGGVPAAERSRTQRALGRTGRFACRSFYSEWLFPPARLHTHAAAGTHTAVVSATGAASTELRVKVPAATDLDAAGCVVAEVAVRRAGPDGGPGVPAHCLLLRSSIGL
jgi:hypothetical protein